MTDAMTSQVAEVARGLTKAQQECVLRGSAIGGVAHSRTTATALVERGIATFMRGMRGTVVDWTPLGLLVKAHLETDRG